MLSVRHARTDQARETHRYEQVLSAFLSEKWGAPAKVSDLVRVQGGIARETFRCDVSHADGRRGLIVRVEGGPELRLSAFRREYDALELARCMRILVPRVEFVEEDPCWLGAAFALVEEIPGCTVSADGFGLDADVRRKLGEQTWSLLGELAAAPIEKYDVPGSLPAPSASQCGPAALDHWRSVYLAHEIHPDPVVRAAIRWLGKNLPEPAQRLALVHGDYRLGNLLRDTGDNVQAIIDWELAHIGDPLEDLAWSLDARQDANRPELAAGLVPHREAVAWWVAASGLHIDSEAFHWWQVLNALKAMAIWVVAGHQFDRTAQRRPSDARMGWLLLERQRRILVDLVSPLGGLRYYRYES